MRGKRNKSTSPSFYLPFFASVQLNASQASNMAIDRVINWNSLIDFWVVYNLFCFFFQIFALAYGNSNGVVRLSCEFIFGKFITKWRNCIVRRAGWLNRDRLVTKLWVIIGNYIFGLKVFRVFELALKTAELVWRNIGNKF